MARLRARVRVMIRVRVRVRGAKGVDEDLALSRLEPIDAALTKSSKQVQVLGVRC